MAKVKRTYTSARRQDQARQTRRSVLAAAENLFVMAGYGATSLQQIADEAGVSVQTIYATFGNKPALLAEVLDTTIAGDDEAIAVNDRDWMHDVFNHPDPSQRLDAYANAVAGIYQRAGDIFHVVRAAATADPDLAPLAATTEQRRRTGATSVINGIAAIDGLRHDLTTENAVDILWTLNSPDVYQRLVRDSNWSLTDYRVWLADIMARALLANPPN